MEHTKQRAEGTDVLSRVERRALHLMVRALDMKIRLRPELMGGEKLLGDGCSIDAHDSGFTAGIVLNGGRIDAQGAQKSGRIKLLRTGRTTSRYEISVSAQDSNGLGGSCEFHHPPEDGGTDTAAIEHFSTVRGVWKALNRYP